MDAWRRQYEKAVAQELKTAGFDHEAVVAETLVRHISTIERVDQMIVQAEGRRNAVLREIDRHRDAVARRLRDAVAEVEDAQFEEIAPEGAAP